METKFRGKSSGRPRGWRGGRVVALAAGLVPLTGCPGSDLCDKCALSCEVLATTPVAFSESTALGSPEQLFAPFAGTCQAPFHWDASGASDAVVVTPAQGDSTISATVTLDPASARLVTYTAPAMCPDRLLIDGRATLTLPAGQVAAPQSFTLSGSPGMAPRELGFTIAEAALGPWITLQKTDPASTVSLTVSLSPIGQACAGQVRLAWSKVASGSGVGWSGSFAGWSSTGCGVGQVGVDLAQPIQGIAVGAEVADHLGQSTWSGTWNDGSPTRLTLTTTGSTTMACGETQGNGFTVVTLPVEVLASTSDGRVQGLAGQGTVRVTLNQEGIWQEEVNASLDLPCATYTARLPYTGANCATDAKVTAQIHLTRNLVGQAREGGDLCLYIYERQNPEAGGAADRVDCLSLTP
jgi:hypothetical protein